MMAAGSAFHRSRSRDWWGSSVAIRFGAEPRKRRRIRNPPPDSGSVSATTVTLPVAPSSGTQVSQLLTEASYLLIFCHL